MANATTDQTFKEDVIDSNKPSLVDFWAPWCGPCRMLGPVIEGIGTKLSGKANVYKVNVDENPRIAQQFGISSIPTVIIFNQGKAVKQFVGVMPEAAYMNEINQLLG